MNWNEKSSKKKVVIPIVNIIWRNLCLLIASLFRWWLRWTRWKCKCIFC